MYVDFLLANYIYNCEFWSIIMLGLGVIGIIKVIHSIHPYSLWVLIYALTLWCWVFIYRTSHSASNPFLPMVPKRRNPETSVLLDGKQICFPWKGSNYRTKGSLYLKCWLGVLPCSPAVNYYVSKHNHVEYLGNITRTIKSLQLQSWVAWLAFMQPHISGKLPMSNTHLPSNNPPALDLGLWGSACFFIVAWHAYSVISNFHDFYTTISSYDSPVSRVVYSQLTAKGRVCAAVGVRRA